ncbi:MAG: glycosyltransferase family 2 protein [Gammaproteobacteria bacterium]|nr:glycosyltransferase family 2 protein [Gammaproteobacteria bacterium]
MRHCPRISIITPCRNSARWLDQAIRSVIDQDFDDWEHIIVDDASSDHSPAIARQYADVDTRIRVEHLAAPRGGAAARNHALKLARGHYIAFLDADDWWRANKLSSQHAFMERHAIPFSFTAYEKTDKTGRLNNRIFHPPPTVDYRALLKTCPIGCSTVMLERAALGGRTMPDLPRSHDYALWLEILRDGHIAQALQEPLTVYRERVNSLSGNKLAKWLMAWHIYRRREGLGRGASLALMAAYACHGLRKRLYLAAPGHTLTAPPWFPRRSRTSRLIKPFKAAYIAVAIHAAR